MVHSNYISAFLKTYFSDYCFIKKLKCKLHFNICVSFLPSLLTTVNTERLDNTNVVPKYQNLEIIRGLQYSLCNKAIL